MKNNKLGRAAKIDVLMSFIDFNFFFPEMTITKIGQKTSEIR